MISKIRNKFRDTKLLVHILVGVFAVASWANLNGMWVELPLLVLEAPEQWTLPSFITIISQVANIGPILFVLITILLPWTKGKIEAYTSAGIIILSVVSSFLIAFFWDKTSYIGGAEHSTALFTLNFFMAFGDCISSVAFYSFMSFMKAEYMASLFIGEGLSGLIPAMMAVGQGAGEIVCVNKSSMQNITINGTQHNETTWNVYPQFVTPSFTVRVYFILLSCILICSLVSFILLNILPYCLSEFVNTSSTDQQCIISHPVDGYGSSRELTFENPDNLESNSTAGMVSFSKSSNPKPLTNHMTSALESFKRILTWQFFLLQGIVVLINLTLTSFLSTIQIYSTLPYGLESYHLATTLTQIANPLACTIALLFMATSPMILSVITVFGQMGVAFIITLAFMSPDPPLHHAVAGGNLAVTVWVFTTLLLVYVKVCVAGVMRTHGRYSLICTGVSTQVGNLIGAIVGFLLVNQYKVFISTPYC